MSERETGFTAPPSINLAPAAVNLPPGLPVDPGRSSGTTNGNGGTANPPADSMKEELLAFAASTARKHLDNAKQGAQVKIKEQLSQMGNLMSVLDRNLDQIVATLDEIEDITPNEPSLEAKKVKEVFEQIEERWSVEIQTLKQELHQTILAHNHNADLVKHHKDTIADLRERLETPQRMSAKMPDLQRKVQSFDASLKQLQDQKPQKVFDAIARRLQEVEAKIRLSMPQPFPAYPGMSPMGMPGFPGMPPGMHGFPLGMHPGMFADPAMAAMLKGAGAKGGMSLGRAAEDTAD